MTSEGVKFSGAKFSKVQHDPTQHITGDFRENIFTALMTQPTVTKHWKRVVSHPDSSHSQAHITTLQ